MSIIWRSVAYVRSRIGEGKLRSYLLPVSSVNSAHQTSQMTTSVLLYLQVRLVERMDQGASSFLTVFQFRREVPGDVSTEGVTAAPVALLTLCCLGSETCRFASKRDRMYKAWPRHNERCTAQSRASFKDRRYSDLRSPIVSEIVGRIRERRLLTVLLVASTLRSRELERQLYIGR